MEEQKMTEQEKKERIAELLKELQTFHFRLSLPVSWGR